ncbi:MAG TPA: threonine synthase [Burkholderiaceae bacterium]|nr:threonine synthase [Burkholderiaceae bacterium]
MRYVSTRGQAPPAPFRAVLLEGLAPDGGLMVPERYPRIDADTLRAWRGLSYAQLAGELMALFADDYAPGELARLATGVYTAASFGSAEVAPLVDLEPGLKLLRLANGPTLSFKDVAMQLLGALFQVELGPSAAALNILAATSGDTGSSAEYAMRGRAAIRVFMLSPHGRMSAFQRAQMYSLTDPNIFNLAVAGTFDDCQDIVKAIASDVPFKQRHRLGAVNSINWARVAAQTVYYFRAYFAATQRNGDPVSFCVPSGNFGNVLAGWIARCMGLPIDRLVVATNENDVLDEFFRTGRYRVRSRSQTRATSSPSMDISKASNFERFVFDLLERDSSRVRDLWDQLQAHGEFDLTQTAQWRGAAACGFASGRSTHADRLATIRSIYHASGRIVDPHTADGIKVARESRRSGVPMICLETAQAAKFSETIVEAIGRPAPLSGELAEMLKRPRRFQQVPPDVSAVRRIIEASADSGPSP